MLPNRAITHFAGPVQVPGGPTLLRVTAPRLRPEEALDRLVLTAIHLVPWAVPRVAPVLYKNPWAARPLTLGLPVGRVCVDVAVGSLAVLFARFVSPPPETDAIFVTLAGAFAATLTVTVSGG